MSEVMVIFASSTDEAISKLVMEKFKRAGISFDFRVLSAHKTPKELDFELNDSAAEIYIAGAGLSAALPGVIAAKKIKPVIAIPCDGAFSGLDAFLSCAQMPSGVPVISTGVVGGADLAVSICGHFLHGFTEIVLIKKATGEEKTYFEKCKKFMEDHKIPFTLAANANKFDYAKVFIDFVKLGKNPAKSQNTVIVCAVSAKTNEKDALKFFSQLSNSYCVGLNNYKNAAIAALQLINLSGNYSNTLVDMRKAEGKKVIDSNKQVSLMSRTAE